MSFEPSRAEHDTSALALTLRALRPLLANPDVTEVCINAPHEGFVETRDGWIRAIPAVCGFRLVRSLRKARRQLDAAADRRRRAALSASLPSGERVQIVLPPATTPGSVAIAIRRPADQVWTIEDLAQRGIFRRTRRAAPALDDDERELLRLLAAGDHPAFMRLAVLCRKNILVSGPTGSGKTTWTKALIREIPTRRAPDHHRGREGIGARPPPESRPPLLLEGRSRCARGSRPSSCSSAACA